MALSRGQGCDALEEQLAATCPRAVCYRSLLGLRRAAALSHLHRRSLHTVYPHHKPRRLRGPHLALCHGTLSVMGTKDFLSVLAEEALE